MKIRKNYFVTIGLSLLTCILFFSGCSKSSESKKTIDVIEPEIVYAVSTVTTIENDLNDYLEFGGDVTAKNVVDVYPDASGKVVDIRVKVGDYVNKDQVLVVIDASRAGMNYAQSSVKAPISGTVTAVNAVVGAMASMQMAVAKIGKTDDLIVSMNVPERFVSKIALGQEASLKLDAYPGETFPAKVVEISPVLDTSSRTMGVNLAVTSKDSRIKAGMFARVKLITASHKDVVTVPESAVISRYGETFVFVISKEPTTSINGYDVVKRVPVKIGIRVDDKREIIEGLTSGEEVVIRGQTLLEDGSFVNIVSRTDVESTTEAGKN